MLPTERRHVPEKVLVDWPALAPQIGIGNIEIFRIPEDDCCDQQVEPGGPEKLVLEAAIAHFAEPAEIDGASQRVARFALVEAKLGAAAESWVLDPIECEQRALDSTDLAQRFCETVLARIGRQLLEHGRTRGRAGTDRGCQPQQLIPMGSDVRGVDDTADQWLEARRRLLIR